MVEPLAGVGLAEQCHGFRWHMKEQQKKPTNHRLLCTNTKWLTRLSHILFSSYVAQEPSSVCYAMPFKTGGQRTLTKCDLVCMTMMMTRTTTTTTAIAMITWKRLNEEYGIIWEIKRWKWNEPVKTNIMFTYMLWCVNSYNFSDFCNKRNKYHK